MATAAPDRGRILVEGKEEESDGEINPIPPAPKHNIPLGGRRLPMAPPVPHVPQQGVVVSGEASESDEEICDTRSRSIYQSDYDLGDTSQRSRHSSRESSQTDLSNFDLPKYNTLLHKKLRDRNLALRQDLVEMACQPYQTASKEISAISQQLIKSQLLVQEVSCTLRRLTNELFQLEDKVDTIRSCNLLPEILIASMPPDEP